VFSHKDMIYAIYKEKSFSKAAQKLFISQPSLSAMVKKEEARIGAPLFDRSAKPITLTEAGKAYMATAEQIDHLEQNYRDYVQALNNLEAGSLFVGSNQLFSTWVLPGFVDRFMRTFPGVSISLTEGNSTALRNGILAGQLDLVVDNSTPDPALFECRKLGREHLLLALPEAMADGGGMCYQDICDKKHLEPAPDVDLHRFRDVPFILMNRDNDTRQRTEELFGNFSPRVIMELDRMDTIYRYIRLGTAASVVSDTLVFNALPADNVRFFPLEHKHFGREIYVSYKKNKFCTRAMDAFMEQLQDFAK